MSERAIIEAFEKEFARVRSQGEKMLQQFNPAHLNDRINPLQNSVAVIVQHMAGNMLSRFTDFLTTDGEKPDRNREGEFVERKLSDHEVQALWDKGWTCVFQAMKPLTDIDALRPVTLYKEPLPVAQVLARNLAHYAWHVGQIALIGKHLIKDRWNYITVPPGGVQIPPK